MIDEHRKVMGSHQISIRAADLLEDMRPQHYNGMNRAQTVRTINDILQGRTERTVDAFLIGLRNTGGEDYAQRVEEISREIQAFLTQKELLTQPYTKSSSKQYKYRTFDSPIGRKLKIVNQRLYDCAAKAGFPPNFFRETYFDRVTFYCIPDHTDFNFSTFSDCFANEPTPGAMPLNVAVGQLNMELANTLETMQTGDYDSIDIQGQGPDWREVVAVFAARTAGADDGIDVAALTPDRVDRLKAVFWDMCAISSEVETISHPDSDPDDDTDDSWTERILHITITAKTAEDMRTEYAFTEYQNQALTELLAELSTMELLLTDLSASQEQARNILRNLPDGLSPERRAVVETACRLVGKVNYFWGGKSRVIGWDSRWGTIQKVWADGSSTTGTYRPYGLDCSGFVDWVFYNISDGAYTIGHGGGAHAQHTYCTAITWTEAQPGDLVFYPEDTHVGIVGGWDESGNILIIHCASGYNNVVVTKQEGFTTIGRPLYYSE